MVNVAAVESALTPISGALAADGYELAVSQPSGDLLRVQISAGPEACEECLIGKSMMQSMIETALKSAGLQVPPLDVVYPVEGPGASTH
jgi:hypothetical protein